MDNSKVIIDTMIGDDTGLDNGEVNAYEEVKQEQLLEDGSDEDRFS